MGEKYCTGGRPAAGFAGIPRTDGELRLFCALNLLAGIWSSSEKAQTTTGNPAPLVASKYPDLRWQLCSGMGGSFRLESVATLLWNTHASFSFG